ncbi:MAG: hypothetical protein WBK96_08275, partial [Candidatus Manganitrophaceae bacterium]
RGPRKACFSGWAPCPGAKSRQPDIVTFLFLSDKWSKRETNGDGCDFLNVLNRYSNWMAVWREKSVAKNPQLRKKGTVFCGGHSVGYFAFSRSFR